MPAKPRKSRSIRAPANENLLAEYAKRVPGRLPDDLVETDMHLNLVVSTVEQLDLTDDLLAAFHRPLWDLLRTIDWGRDLKITDQVFSDGDDRFINRTPQLPLSFEDAQAPNWQWVERLAEQDQSWPMEKMECSCATVGPIKPVPFNEVFAPLTRIRPAAFKTRYTLLRLVATTSASSIR